MIVFRNIKNMSAVMSVAAFFLALMLCSRISIAGEPVVAKVNGTPVTDSELEEAIDQFVPRGIFHGKVAEDRREEFREKALEALITMELQYQDAIARGMKPDRQQVKLQMRKTRESFRSEWEYKIWLQKKNLNEEQLRQRIERLVLVRAAIEKITEEPAQVSDEILQKYYAANTGKFQEPASVRLRIISTKNEQTALKALEAVKGGEEFASVAARMSEDTFRDKGGYIGQVRKGMIYPQLEVVAFEMKTGQVSSPVLAEGIWFLLKVEEVLPARTLPFSEARENLKKELEQKKSAELLDQWVDGLRAKADIVVFSSPDQSEKAKSKVQ